MARIGIAGGGFDRGDKIRRIEKGLDDPKGMLKQIGAMAVAVSQRSFKLQRLGTKSWDARAPVNVMGIIADFHAGKKSPPKRRFQPRPALRDTGRLAASISFEVKGSSVDVGSNLPYAGVHQRGGKSKSKPINDQVRSLLGKWLKRQNKGMKSRLGWLLNKKFAGKSIEANIPARPFLGLTRDLVDDVKAVVGVNIAEVR